MKRYLTAQAVDAMQRNAIQDPVEVLSKYAHCQDYHPDLDLLGGPSGIGKSRFVAKQCEGMEVVSLDEIREQLAPCGTPLVYRQSEDPRVEPRRNPAELGARDYRGAAFKPNRDQYAADEVREEIARTPHVSG